MNTIMFAVAVATLSLGAFGAVYWGALLTTRPGAIAAAPATPELGDEAPAVVNLLCNGWRLNADAAEATLLDLAARRLIELRQPGDNPYHTTIHLGPDEPGDLSPYEKRVWDRIRGLAVHGALPVSALTFRNQQRARTWTRRLHHEVITQARQRGLSRRRFGPGVVSALLTTAAVTSGGLFLAVLLYVLARFDEPPVEMAAGVGLAAFALLSAVAVRPPGERSTEAGRAVAASWLGVQRWLRNHEEFAGLPPAAVTVWDRYLSYGAALGVTRTASAVLDLGMGDRGRVWSSHGGMWRRVRVSYPRFLPWYGATLRGVLRPAVFALAMAGPLLFAGWRTSAVGAAGGWTDDVSARIAHGVVLVCVPLGLLLAVGGGYVAVRAIADRVAPRTVTGQVLWRQTWRHLRRDDRRVPVMDHLAIDEGTRDRTRAWALPVRVDGGCRHGDLVTATVRPWTRRIVALTVREVGRVSDAAELGEEVELDPLPSTRRGRRSRVAGIAVGELLTADEVSHALHVPVVGARVQHTSGTASAMFYTSDDRPVLAVQVATGLLADMGWAAISRGQPLPGIGTGAYLGDDVAAARVGEHTVTVMLTDEDGRADLGALLRLAVDRMAARSTTG
jgi:hypothetical protein